MRANLIALIASLVAGTAAAQEVHKSEPRPRPKAVVGAPAGTVAAIAPPPTVVVTSRNASLFAPAGSFLGNVPVVVFPDGRVFVDFGRGFEQVVRGCPGNMALLSSVLPPPVQPTVVQPTVIQPPAVVTQPLPYNPPIAGQQLVAQPLTPTTAGQILAGESVIVNSNACWAVNGYGQVFVFRP
jgi:hypothetical protein